jgi:hypothetical protein
MTRLTPLDATNKTELAQTIANHLRDCPASERNEFHKAFAEKMGAMMPLTISALQRVNEARCSAPNGFSHPLDGWSTMEWFGAMFFEFGEGGNIAKKLRRHEQDVRGNKPNDRDPWELKRRAGKEAADTIIYGILILSHLGQDAEEVIRSVFNEKSDEIGYPGIV